MTREDLLAQIRLLPVEERIDLIEQVEDELAEDPIDPNPGPIPDWQIAELEDRMNDPNEVANIPWEKVRKDLGFPPR